jgi:hypothetical protein
MNRPHRLAMPALLGAALLATTARAADPPAGMTKGTPELKSAGALAFGPNGLLFIGDTKGGSIFAIETGDTTPPPSKATLKVEAINEKIAGLLGTTAKSILIQDVAVNPASGKAYLSVARGNGPDAKPAILCVDGSGSVELVSLDNVNFAKASLPNLPAADAPRNGRTDAITDLAFLDGKVFVAGLSNENFASRLMAIPYPFVESGDGTSVEIYHGAHGGYETKSPVRTFVPYSIKGEPHLLAAYTCTPLVKIPLASLKPGSHVKGKTIAELGNRNKPLDLVAYSKDGKDYLLLANSSRGVMKIAIEGADAAEPITERVAETKGVPYDTIADLKGVEQLDKLDHQHGVILIRSEGGTLDLRTIDLP